MRSLASSSKTLESVPEKRLALYRIAAGAALVAAGSTAEANLITLDLTGQPIASRTTPLGGSLFFDVNASSAAAAFATSSFAGADFQLTHPSVPYAYINGNGIPGNAIAGFTAPAAFKASHLSQSNFVGPTNNFAPAAKIAPAGAWSPNTTGFLGLQFVIGPNSYFGWADITTNSDASVTLNALGYEDVPNTPAHAEFASAVPDQGSTLALLAIGAAGVVAFRRRQPKAASAQ